MCGPALVRCYPIAEQWEWKVEATGLRSSQSFQGACELCVWGIHSTHQKCEWRLTWLALVTEHGGLAGPTENGRIAVLTILFQES